MRMALYDELVPWYRLLDPHHEHEDEAQALEDGFRRVVAQPRTLLELGSGAGNNAFFLKRAMRCTLTDVSEPMLALSRELNPECEHIAGDMRDLRLDRTFDAVLVHDSITYMTTEAELRAVAQTAFVHTRPGGAAIFAPDCFRETFAECTEEHEGDEGGRSMRCLAWVWDPDPSDSTYRVDYAFLLREHGEVRAVHDTHVEGLFDLATWKRILEGAGFEVDTIPRPMDEAPDGHPYCDRIFLCRRPAGVDGER